MAHVSIRISPRLAAIPHYEPGLTTAQVLARYGVDSAVKLASNESPYPPMDEVVAAIVDGARRINRYPDGPGRELRRALADIHGFDPGQVVLGNGSCELLLLAGQALLDPGRTLVHAAPSFGLYGHLATAAGAGVVAIDLDHDGGHDLDTMAAAVDETCGLVIVCNPNNPTGVYRSADAIERFLDLLPEDLPVLVDEAYNEFVTHPDRGRVLSLARTRPNVLVLRTFSKAHGLCGLRVGYALGSEGWIAALERVRQPFNTNALAQVAALASLARREELERRLQATIAERGRMEHGLRADGWAFTPSQANFILATPFGDSAVDSSRIHEQLLRGGVIVRDGAKLGCPGRLRISIGTPDENAAFAAARAQLARPTPRETQQGRTRQ